MLLTYGLVIGCSRYDWQNGGPCPGVLVYLDEGLVLLIDVGVDATRDQLVGCNDCIGESFSECTILNIFNPPRVNDMQLVKTGNRIGISFYGTETKVLRFRFKSQLLDMNTKKKPEILTDRMETQYFLMSSGSNRVFQIK